MAGTRREFYGKYRASVLVNEDPKRLGRLTLQVPDVLVFLFCRKVAVGNWKRQMFGTKELFHPVVIGLTPQQKAELVMAGRWPAKVVN